MTTQRNSQPDFDYVGSSTEKLLEKFSTSLKGLTESEVQGRLKQFGFNEPAPKKKKAVFLQLFSRFLNPLVIVLLVIAGLSLFLGEKISAILVLSMAVLSVLISFIQEYHAGKEVEKLNAMVRSTTSVSRQGKVKEIPIREVVPGDIFNLFAGDMIPADIRIIQAKDLFINQSNLTGESLPVEKAGEPQSKNVFFAQSMNIAFMGSSVVSGTGLGLVIKTGLDTQFGAIYEKLIAENEESGFDKGIKKFTWLMIRAMIILVIIICVVNFFLKGSFIQALLFSLAVAVGLTPEMLPMLVAINLSKGAIAMSKREVIVKRLNAIQNFGAMDVLCTDKTGTITLDRIVLEKYCDVVGKDDKSVLLLAYTNSFYQTGLKNILDKAVLKYEKLLVKQYKKIDEIPFDFSRRLMSVVVEMDGKHKIITKGAPEEIFKRCAQYELDGKFFEFKPFLLTDLKKEYDSLSSQGFRVLAVAYKDTDKSKDVYSKDDEKGLILKGYIAFLDPPKPTARKAIEVLRNLGIELKILTGDNELVTRKICSEVGIEIKGLATGEQVENLTDAQLKELVNATTVFARVSPLQKERVIRALQNSGRTVGYMGDGINDELALSAGDVVISVNNAVDIAKESADISFLPNSLVVARA